MARKMALDIGSKRIGVAISDTLLITAHGLAVIKRDSSFSEIAEISKMVEEYQVDEVIVGMPKDMRGGLGKQARLIGDYNRKLQKELKVPVKSWDERLTTSLAKKTLAEAGTNRKKRKEVVDKVAAVVILQSYLDSVNRGT